VLVTGGNRYNVQDNQISGNAAYAGGGLFVYTATGSIINNQIRGNGAVWYGGGMYLSTQASPAMDRNVVMSNTATGTGGFAGGGLMLNAGAGTRITLTNHIIARNTATTGSAGGVHCLTGACAFIHCTVADNKLASGPGEGVRIGALGGTNVLWNSILAGHSTGMVVAGGVSVLLDYNDYYGNTANISGAGEGAHDYHFNPQFAGQAAGDYHLTASSPLINIGDGSLSMPHDFEGDLRLLGPDIGADEFARHIFLPLILRQEEGPGPRGYHHKR
jgi:hypothetical protein